jgi:citrate lyase subunit gamma (acyl carrier protein)
MDKITQIGQAGTIESNDIMITIAPGENGIVIDLISPVHNQYGKQIVTVIEDTLTELGIVDAVVMANDKGALDCTIKARVQTAVMRALTKEEFTCAEV